MNFSNVVQLDSAREGSGLARHIRKMNAPFIDLQQRSQRELASLLQKMFDKADDALFELAERASSNSEQNLYFESMREIRLRRREIESRFSINVESAYAALFEQQNTKQDSNETAELSVMENDVLEEIVAIEGMVTKAEKLYQKSIAALSVRITHLADDATVDQKNNPIGPNQVCDAFSKACLLLSLDIKARLVLFKLFDKHVVSEFGKIYDACNNLLIAHDVLPDVRGVTQSGRPTGGESMSGRSDAPITDDIASNIVEVFGHLSQIARNNVAQNNANIPDYSIPTATKNPAFNQQTLMQVLSALQHHNTYIAGAEKQLLELQTPSSIAEELLNSLKAMANGGEYSIHQTDRDAITLVGMLFQFVLEDRSLAEPIKALISRLQIPVIKIALSDPTLFAKPGHPARKLLNEMTTAAIGWVATDDWHEDALYSKIQSCVMRVLDEYEDDINIFTDVLADFISFVDNESRKARLLEKRIVDAQAGREQSEAARSHVKQLIDQQPLDKTADFVNKLINDVWSNVLFLVYLKDGAESEQWQKMVTVLTDLVWTVHDDRCAIDRGEIVKRLPKMLKSLRAGLLSINYDSFAAGEFFGALEMLHRDVMQRSRPLSSEQTEKAAAESAEKANAEAPETKPELKTVKEDSASAECLADDNIYLLKAKALGVGQWVELYPQPGKKMRCRLVAIMRTSGKRIFANRSGVKVGEYTVADIAELLENKNIALLEDSQLFDKALSSVIDNLREMQAAHA